MFVTGSALPVMDLARACEERGLESLWVPEHPLVPARYETRYPLSDDGKLPRPYTELPDCFATLAAAAGVTRSSVYRSEEHTSELQSLTNLVCRLLLEKKKQHR